MQVLILKELRVNIIYGVCRVVGPQKRKAAGTLPLFIALPEIKYSTKIDLVKSHLAIQAAIEQIEPIEITV
jgi:hypothetical protein